MKVKTKQAIRMRNTVRKAIKALKGIEDLPSDKQVKRLRKAVDATAEFTQMVGETLPEHGIITTTQVVIGDPLLSDGGFMETIIRQVVDKADRELKDKMDAVDAIDAEFEEVDDE